MALLAGCRSPEHLPCLLHRSRPLTLALLHCHLLCATVYITSVLENIHGIAQNTSVSSASKEFNGT